MCGIVGHFRMTSSATSLDERQGKAALLALSHRGPDSGGVWRSSDNLCWLGHRRLAIIDLDAGLQPMSNGDGSVWVTFNGEIYNYPALRNELVALGHFFRTQSDTEVLVHGYEAWGALELAKRLQGIFAFAIYDIRKKTILLCRDPMGVKPLYWWSDKDTLIFASEMKSLLCFNEIQSTKKVYKPGIAQYIVTRYVSRPNTLFEGVYRLPEGCLMEIQYGKPIPEPVQYWDMRFESKGLNEAEALEKLDGLLKHTVDMQLMSDVPLGVQLSGGVDSSMVLAMMATLQGDYGLKEPIKTFSVGFDIPQFSELHYAKSVANQYATEHHEIVVGANDFVADFSRLCWLYDEPMGEPSAIPTYYMCKAAKEHVTVMLSGEGADEVFGGYSKYVFDGFSKFLTGIPKSLRQSGMRSLGAMVPFKVSQLRRIFEILGLSAESHRFASWYGGFDVFLQKELLHPDFLRDTEGEDFSATFSAILKKL